MAAQSLKKPDLPFRENESKPAAFSRSILETFHQAERKAGCSVERHLRLGGHSIRLCYAGQALVPRIMPALQHLVAEPDPAPSLTACIWDSVSTGTTMPPPPWSKEDYLARGEVRGYNTDRYCTAFHLGTGALSMLDKALGIGFFWIRDARELPTYESGAPLRSILHWWGSGRGLQLVHAAAVGTREGGVLLAGKGGSGKTTTALACLDSDLAYASDDYCLLAADPVPYAHSLYNSAKIGAEAIRRLPRLAPAVAARSRFDESSDEKALLFLHELRPEKIARAFPIRAVLIPQITGRPETRLKKTSIAASAKSLGASTVFQLPAAGPDDFARITDFVRKVRESYILELGTDIAWIPRVILDLLSGSGASHA